MNRWHWPIALATAASLHLAVAAVAPTGMPQLPGAQALGEGEGGFEIGLGYLGGFADRLETAPDVELAEPEVPAPEVTQEPEVVTEPPPVEEVVEPEPEPTPIPVQVAVVAPPAPKPPQPKPDPKPTPSKLATQPPAEPVAAPAPATTAKAEGPAQAAMVAGSGSGRDRRAGGRAGGSGARSYYSDLMAALNRHKTYPPELKKRKTQGTVTVAFAIGAAGDLLRAQVTQTSGHPELDAAALAMLQKAAPLPPIPREFNRAELSVELPVEYSLITD